MTEHINPNREMRFLKIATMIVIILYGINQAQSVLVLFIVSIFSGSHWPGSGDVDGTKTYSDDRCGIDRDCCSDCPPVEYWRCGRCFT